IYDTTGAIGAARACILADGDDATFASFTKDDHIMTYTPEKDTSAYTMAYHTWKKELELLINT
ncbi:MAG: carbohydrate kinase, partial [Flavobacteriaceae bacterium]